MCVCPWICVYMHPDLIFASYKPAVNIVVFCVCMCVCVYVRTCVCVYMCMCVNIIAVSLYISWCKWCMCVVCVHVRDVCMYITYVCVRVCVYMCVCVFMYVCVYVCINTYTHVCMYVCMYTHVCMYVYMHVYYASWFDTNQSMYATFLLRVCYIRTLECIIIETRADSILVKSNVLRPVLAAIMHPGRLFNIIVHVSWNKWPRTG
jgi:hypothetical protein